MNEAELNKLTRIAHKETVRKTEEPPKVEIITPSEVYLLDGENHRVKRICGAQDEFGWPCTLTAGHGTFHEGESRCRKHEGKEVGKREYLERYLDVLNSDNRLKKYFELANIADKEAYSVENLTRITYALLIEHLNQAQYNWTKKEAFFVLTLIEQMRKMQETTSKIETQKVIANSISAWLRAVFQVIQNSVSYETFLKIREQIAQIAPPEEIETIEFKEV